MSRFKNEYLSFLDIFASCPQSHQIFIRSWVQIEQVRDLRASSHQKYSLKNNEINDLVENWSKDKDPVFVSLLPETKLLDYAVSETLMMRWAFNEWGHRLESLYLERKVSLDHISCSLIRMQDPLLASEIYHRLNSDKIPFDQLSWQFGEGPERKNCGYFPLMRASRLPAGFLPLIKKLKVGEILKPHKIGKWNVIIQLHELVQAEFNKETQDFILKTEVDAWSHAVSKKLLSSLESMQTHE